MKTLKIVFLVFSILLLISCEKNESGNEIEFSNYLSEAEVFEVNHPKFEYAINGADFVYINSFGVIDFNNVKKTLHKSGKKRKCTYFKEEQVRDGHVFQTATMMKYFDYVVDGVKVIPIPDENGLLRVEVGDNASLLVVKLKKRFFGTIDLRTLPVGKGRHCLKRGGGKFEILLPIIPYGKYSEIDRFIRINFTAKLMRGFRS